MDKNQVIITKEMGVNMKRRLKIANDINEFLTSNPQVIIQSLPDNLDMKQRSIDEIRSINKFIPIGIQTMSLDLNTLNATYITGVRLLYPVDRINDIMMTQLDDDKDNGAFDAFNFILTSLGPIPYNVRFPDNDNPKIKLSQLQIKEHQEKSPPKYEVIEYGTEEKKCDICLETKTQWYFSILFRCGHYACNECCRKLLSEPKCHICRNNIIDFIPMYVNVEEEEPEPVPGAPALKAPAPEVPAPVPEAPAPGLASGLASGRAPRPILSGGKDKKKSKKKNLVKNLKKRLGKSCKKNLVKRSKRIYKSFKVINQDKFH